MSDVKRYDYGYKDDGCGGDRYLGLIEKPDGALVRHSDYAALEAECDKLRAQVSALQSDANSWQSGYDKGREDGAKAADGWKAQHARDSAELRRLCAERDALAAELEAVRSALAGDGRDEFEAMCRSQHRNITRDDRPDPPLAWGYANSLTHDRWCGWAAAWKRARALVADRRANQGGEA